MGPRTTALHLGFVRSDRTDDSSRLAAWRTQRGLPATPMRAFAESGYQDQIVAERVGGTQSAWGA